MLNGDIAIKNVAMTSIYDICLHQVSTTIDKVTCYLVNCVYGEYNYSYCGLKKRHPNFERQQYVQFLRHVPIRDGPVGRCIAAEWHEHLWLAEFDTPYPQGVQA